MIVFALGNPGKKYTNTRHNAGFLVMDKIKEDWDFPDFKYEKRFEADISEGNFEKDGKKIGVTFVRPQTFMNESGRSVRTFLDFYKLPTEDIVVIHDDLDISLGKFKLATDSRSAGHNGVQSIIDALGSQKFRRIRIGIAKSPEEKATCPISGHNYVLEKFSKKETELLRNVFDEIENELKKMIS